MSPSVETDLLRTYARLRPAAFAWWRYLELLAYADTPITSPVLDLGCGDGIFGQFIYQDHQAFGIDLSHEELRRVPGGIYQGVCQSSALALPYANRSFQTVLSNCVMEHIAGLEVAVAEAHRVLRPGGHLIGTVPSARFGEMLLGARVLQRIGIAPLAQQYSNLINRFLDHKNLLDDRQWSDLLGTAGFGKVQVTPIVSPQQLALFEAGMVPAVPGFVSRRLTSHWAIVPKPGLDLILKQLARLSQPATSENCAAYMLVAQA